MASTKANTVNNWTEFISQTYSTSFCKTMILYLTISAFIRIFRTPMLPFLISNRN